MQQQTCIVKPNNMILESWDFGLPGFLEKLRPKSQLSKDILLGCQNP